MKLSYEDEFIKNPDGIFCHVLNIGSIDFSKTHNGIKNEPILVIRAEGGEDIVSCNLEGKTESSYVANKGDCIFYSDKDDQYIPYDIDGNAFKFSNIESYGYEIISANIKVFDEKYKSNDTLKVRRIKPAKLLIEVIDEPTCIKYLWGLGKHQFLFKGATLKQDPDTGRISGIDKDAFDKTWKVID